MVFRACIQVDVGGDYAKRVEDKLHLALKNYLATTPENYIDVYRRTYACEETDLHARLLRDKELQTQARKEFHWHAEDMAIYLYALSKFDQSCSKELLDDFTETLTREKGIHEWVQGLDGKQLTLVGHYLTRVSQETAKRLLGKLKAHDVAAIVSPASFRCVQSWIGSSSKSLAAKLGYPKSWRKKVAESLNLSALVKNAEQEPLQSLIWVLRYLRTAAPDRAVEFERKLGGPKKLAEICIARNGTAKDLNDLFRKARPKFRQELVRKLGPNGVVALLNRSPLPQIGYLVEFFYPYVSSCYEQFRRTKLCAKLSKASDADIDRFIARIRRVRAEGQRLAQEARELLFTVR
jgi:hypothetical protein